MSRPQKRRKICIPPKMHGFKPFNLAACENKEITMQYDEYESIKLINYNHLSQDEAVDRMEVSRPTITRIYNKALKKIAMAFVEGNSIIFEGGNFEFEKDWYKCKKCFKLIQGIENHIKCKTCQAYSDRELINLNLPKE